MPRRESVDGKHANRQSQACSRFAASACIYLTHFFSWRRGLGLVSLADMIEYPAPNLVEIKTALMRCALQKTTSPERDSNLELIRNEAVRLGLPSTERGVRRLLWTIENEKPDEEEIYRQLQGLDERFHDEILTLSFFYLPADRLPYYQKTDLFGEQFKAHFPTANAEVIEAGNCLAFDRFTACAYHLSRATEIVLRVLFVSLGLPPRVWSATKWKSITERIGGKIQKNNLRLTNDAQWRADRPFYEKAHAFLESARNPLRNSTMHVDVTYPDEGSVRPVWLATEAFMRHVATKLKE